MNTFAIVVSFTLKPGAGEAFLRLVSENAASSVRDEPGCSRFDVLTSDDPDHVFLYEIYKDEAAFGDHLKTPHFKAFDQASADLIADKTVLKYRAAENAKYETEA